MGRVREVAARAWQTADKMKKVAGRLRAKRGTMTTCGSSGTWQSSPSTPLLLMEFQIMSGRYSRAKWQISRSGTLQFFGAKPKMVVKGGFIAYSLMGDPNASIPTPEPVYYRPMFGALGRAKYSISFTFTSKFAIRNGIGKKLGLQKKLLPVKTCRKIGKRNMLYNNIVPKIDIDPETYEVKVDGTLATTPAAEKLALARLYNLF
jgi:urease subunit alpha